MKRKYERLITLFAVSVSVVGTLAICAAMPSLSRAGTVINTQDIGGRETERPSSRSAPRRGKGRAPRSTPRPAPRPPAPPPTLRPVEVQPLVLSSAGQEIPTDRKQARTYAEMIGSVTLDMVEVPGGTFLRGSPATEAGHDDNEAPRKPVTVKTFYISPFEINQAQWRAVAQLPQVRLKLQSDPSLFKSDINPVENVSWEEAVEFCERLSRLTGRKYRLPSEAEWEYACRAGMTTPFGFGETIVPEFVNFDARRPGEDNPPPFAYRAATTDGGHFRLNGFGLYDMHGNVWEWCQDYFHESYSGAPADGSAYTKKAKSNLRVIRGGSFKSDITRCRCAYRGSELPDTHSNDMGFRVALSAQ